MELELLGVVVDGGLRGDESNRIRDKTTVFHIHSHSVKIISMLFLFMLDDS